MKTGEHGYWFGFESEIQKGKSCIQGKNVKSLLHQEKLLVSKNVMLDFDLVSLYRSETKRLKESNKSNPGKKPKGKMVISSYVKHKILPSHHSLIISNLLCKKHP